MRRGVFTSLIFLVVSTTVVNILSYYFMLEDTRLNYESRILDAEEAFYRARNFETSFRIAAASGSLDEWYSYWKPVYGIRGVMGDCIQVNESFEDFTRQVMRRAGDRIFVEAFRGEPSCIFLNVSYKGFKTIGAIVSPLCINVSSPLSSSCQ